MRKKMFVALIVLWHRAITVGAIASQQERRSCKFYQQMGCLLDGLEKMCSPDDGEPSQMLDPYAEESLWMCCCPTPYKKCSKPERLQTCDLAFTEFIKPLVGQDATKDIVRLAVLRVRGKLREAGSLNCTKFLAPEEPLMPFCGFDNTPKVERSIAREDLFCEMLSWQWEELGDGDSQEFRANNCPYVKKMKGKNGDARKGQQLTPKDFPFTKKTDL